MKALLPIACALALAACKAMPAPEPVIVTRLVNVPVPVPCATRPPEARALPSELVDRATLDALDVLGLTRLALADIKELQAQRAEQSAAAKACAS